ncbi:hypothetical protein QYM36_001490 [Artemia franciscana]|uniref:Chromodomain Y-like protein 2 n=1 Tax=Artemia franciscana TaxID=6661 RepID=A0AA88I6I9_ARTSF|nr:hypothetical protein QYM36_001490 [Artemia franciscana]
MSFKTSSREISRLLRDEGALLMMYDIDSRVGPGSDKVLPENYTNTAASFLRRRSNTKSPKGLGSLRSIDCRTEKRETTQKIKVEKPQKSLKKKEVLSKKLLVGAGSSFKKVNGKAGSQLRKTKGTPSKILKHSSKKNKKHSQKIKIEKPQKSLKKKEVPPKKTKVSTLSSLKKVNGITDSQLRKIKGTPGKVLKHSSKKLKITKILKKTQNKNENKAEGTIMKIKKIPNKVKGKPVKEKKQLDIRKEKSVQDSEDAKINNKKSDIATKSRVSTQQNLDPDLVFSYIFEPRPSIMPPESVIARRRSFGSDSSYSDVEVFEKPRNYIENQKTETVDQEQILNISSCISVEEPPFPVIKNTKKKRKKQLFEDENASETASFRSESSISSVQASKRSVDSAPFYNSCTPIMVPIASSTVPFDSTTKSLVLKPQADEILPQCQEVIRLENDDSYPQKGQRSSLRQIDPYSKYKEVAVKKMGPVTQIILNPVSTSLKNALNVLVLKELRDILLSLRRDIRCKVVLLTSVDRIFCQGVDLPYLVRSTPEGCRKAAVEMAEAIKYFIWTLVHFPKPIVAGINGSCIGLGAAMLPLFDLIYASDTAVFFMPYGKLGQVPEGAISLSFPVVFGNSLTCSLLYGSKKLTATEAQSCGLITGILWPDQFMEELIPMVQALAGHASQVYLFKLHLRFFCFFFFLLCLSSFLIKSVPF